jgi:hypothetical protein
MIIMGDGIQLVKEEIKEKWTMEDLGIAKFAVGIEIERHSIINYYLHQQGMIANALEKFDMQNCKHA